MGVLAADDLRKTYGPRAALRGVSLTVEEGEVFGLIGPNGAGKTTLVRCLTGTTRPDGGTAATWGTDPRHVRNGRLGLLPQDFTPPRRLTPRELLEYFAGLYDEARPIEAVLDAVGVAAAADTRFAALSGGQRRRVLVGIAIVNDPELLVLDEPTTGIDPAGRRAVWSIIEELAAGGATVVLTSHDMVEVERLADRVGVLVDGRLAAVDRPAALVARHGGEPRLVVETDTAVEGRVPGIEDEGYRLDRIDRGVAIEGVERRDVARVVAALTDAGLDFESIAWRRPGLESAYLGLIGEPPRREAGPVEGR